MEEFKDELGGVVDRLAGFREPDAISWLAIEKSVQQHFGDRNLEVVRVGSGTGSYYMYGENTVLLDPRQVYDSEDKERGIRRGVYEALHDGAHAIISRTPDELGLPKDEVKNRYARIGYPFVQTVMEDAAVNRWAVKKTKNAKELFTEAYDGTFSRRELDVLAKYGVTRMEELPRFMQMGFELLRKNQTHWYSRNTTLKFDVSTAVGAVAKAAEDVADTAPRMEFDYFIKRAARRRFAGVDEYVWPEAGALVEKDITTIMQNLARQQKQEFEAAQAAAHENLAEDHSPPVPESWAPIKADFVPQSNPIDLYETPTLPDGKEITWNLWQEPTHFDGIDIRAISDEAAMDVLYPDPLVDLDADQVGILRAQAEQVLKDLEDKVVRAMRMQHAEEDEVAPTHQQLDYDVYKEMQVRLGSAGLVVSEVHATMNDTLSQSASDLTRDLMAEYIGSLDAWDVARAEVTAERDRLYNLLEPIVKKTGEADKIYTSTGAGRLAVRRAMLLDLGISTDIKVFETLGVPPPQAVDAIMFFDISDSMKGFKGDESFKAAVTIADVFDLLGINTLIGVFGDEARIVKDWDDDLESKREPLSNAMKPIRTGTGTHKAARIALDKATDNTRLVVFVTDGYPNDDGKAELLENVRALHTRGIPTLGICLGEESEMIREFFAYSVVVRSFDSSNTHQSPFVADTADAIVVAMRDDVPLEIEGRRLVA